MSLPRRPERSQPIPQQPFSSPEVSLLQGPYWDISVGNGLEVDNQGSLQLEGSESSAPTAYLYGPNGFVGLGTGLELGSNGEIKVTGGGFIYCTPQFSNLPVTYPPYNCETEVNTTGVTNFNDAWANCTGLGEFPCVNTSSGVSFFRSWADSDISSLPALNTHSGKDFSYSFYYCGSLGGTFPVLDFTNAQDFTYTWTRWDQSGEALQFPEGCFDTCSKDGPFFGYSFYGCHLTQQSVDNVLSSLDNSGSKGGLLWMFDPESSNPSSEVLDSSVASLFEKGWEIILPDGTEAWEIFDPVNFSCSTEVNTAGIVNLAEAWKGCSSLTSFPALDVSSGINFYGTWQNCSSLTSFPTLSVSSGINFFRSWQGCSELTSFPSLNVSSGINFGYTWGSCSSLTSFPTLNVSSGTNFNGTWSNCSGLTSFPLLDVSSGINFNSTWYGCSSLTSFPALNVSSGTNFYATWRDCSSLTSFPLLDVSSGVNFGQAWFGCTSLVNFPAGMFDSCSATAFNGAWFNCALTQQSVDNILVSLDTAGQSNGTVGLNGGTSAAPGAAGLVAITSLQGKGWTVFTN